MRNPPTATDETGEKGKHMETIIKEALGKLGVEFQEYNLVNNHGMTAETDQSSIDIRHWLNLYGVDVDYWDIRIVNKETREQKYEETLDRDQTAESLAEHIKLHI